KIAMLLKFGWDRDLESLESIYKRAEKKGVSLEELAQKLDVMAKKGSIMSKREGDKIYYGNALLAIGMFEFQVNRLTKEFVNDFEEYYMEAWLPESIKVKAAQLRTIPVEQSIEPEHNVSTYDDLENLLETTNGPFVIMNCICKQVKDVLEDPCKITNRREICMAFGTMAQLYIDQEWGRQIKKEEALEILRKNEEEGHVFQPSNSQDLCFICSCCGCCCENLTNLALLPNPGNFSITNYYAEVDSDLCSGCGTCVEICPMKAITLKEDVSLIKKKRCIGCGNCVAKCPSEAIKLLKRERQFEPFPTMDYLFDRVMQRKINRKEKGLKS
ncbi:MAG: 4Fe-4S dicluster domain-containing protein, partial [Promethearchaeota archaeon]